jgi:hypothetical protein
LVLGASSASATVDAVDITSSEGGQKIIKETVMIARSKPALAVATGIICIACGILVAKTFG